MGVHAPIGFAVVCSLQIAFKLILNIELFCVGKNKKTSKEIEKQTKKRIFIRREYKLKFGL